MASSSPPPPPPLLSLLPDGCAALVLQGLTLNKARRLALTTSVAVRDAFEEPLSLAYGSKAWFWPVKRLLDRFELAILYYELQSPRRL